MISSGNMHLQVTCTRDPEKIVRYSSFGCVVLCIKRLVFMYCIIRPWTYLHVHIIIFVRVHEYCVQNQHTEPCLTIIRCLLIRQDPVMPNAVIFSFCRSSMARSLIWIRWQLVQITSKVAVEQLVRLITVSWVASVWIITMSTHVTVAWLHSMAISATKVSGS